MEGIITLPYSEYAVANKLNTLFKKKDGYSLFIPASRQQKGVDLLLVNLQANKIAKIQIKASRAYQHSSQIKQSQFGIWFNNFIDRYQKGNADYYILYGLYPVYKQNGVSSKDAWQNIFLCFNEKEMFDFLKRVKTKKEEKKDAFFGFQFDNNKTIYTGRGIKNKENVSHLLLENKTAEIQKKLSKA